jgi:hypothetical protein
MRKLLLIGPPARRFAVPEFLDEFDALGGERGTKNDVGEIRRVLNSFLQFLELDDLDSVVMGAQSSEASGPDAIPLLGHGSSNTPS